MDLSDIDTFSDKETKEVGQFPNTLASPSDLAMYSEIFFRALFWDQTIPVEFWPYAVHHALHWFKNFSNPPEPTHLKSPLNIAYGLDATSIHLKRGGVRVYTGLPHQINEVEEKLRNFECADDFSGRMQKAIAKVIRRQSSSFLKNG